MPKKRISIVAERQSVTNSRRRPASRNATTRLCHDQAMTGRQIGNGRSMQDKWRTLQSGNAILDGAEIAQSHALQFERDRVRRGPFRLACRRTVTFAHREIDETLGHQPGKLACRGCGKCRPHEGETRILPSRWLVHAGKYVTKSTGARCSRSNAAANWYSY